MERTHSFSTRTTSALKKAGIKTNEDLMGFIRRNGLDKVVTLRGIGDDALNEITDWYTDVYPEIIKEEQGDDAIRYARFFIDHTNIDTPQNNTAFINGLALILSAHSGQQKGETQNE